MAKATFLNTTTLKVVEAADERLPMEFVQAAEQYYKMSGIETIISPEEGYYLIKDRKAKKSIDGVKTVKYKKFYSLEVAKQWMEENGAPLRAYDKY